MGVFADLSTFQHNKTSLRCNIKSSFNTLVCAKSKITTALTLTLRDQAKDLLLIQTPRLLPFWLIGHDFTGFQITSLPQNSLFQKGRWGDWRKKKHKNNNHPIFPHFNTNSLIPLCLANQDWKCMGLFSFPSWQDAFKRQGRCQNLTAGYFLGQSREESS